MALDPFDPDLAGIGYSLPEDEADRILREHGLDPAELRDDERSSLLRDYISEADAGNSRLSNISPDDED